MNEHDETEAPSRQIAAARKNTPVVRRRDRDTEHSLLVEVMAPRDASRSPRRGAIAPDGYSGCAPLLSRRTWPRFFRARPHDRRSCAQLLEAARPLTPSFAQP